MARFVYGESLGDNGLFTDRVNPNALSPVEQSTTLDRYEDLEGDGIEAVGTAFDYSGLIPTDGTMTRLNAFTSTGDPLLTITGLSVNLGDFYQTFSLSGIAAAVASLSLGNDVFIGSSNDDTFYGGTGADRIKGFAGRDAMLGGQGRDVLTGGLGADQFMFMAGDGVDVITDFRDTGGVNDDKIVIVTSRFGTMVKVDVVGGVELRFGGGDKVLVEGATAAQIGLDDFLLI